MDNLPPTGCEITILSAGSYRRWSPLPVHVFPGLSDLVLVCHDAEPVDDLIIRFVDAATGERLKAGWATIELEGCERSQTSIAGQGLSMFTEVAFDALTEWYVEAEGYAPRWGDASVFAPEGDKLVAEVALESGWAARIRTVRAGTLPAEPLAGVLVQLDGEAAGVTDEDGQLILIRETAPSKVEVSIEGWTYVNGSLDAETGQLSKYAPRKVLRFGQ